MAGLIDSFMQGYINRVNAQNGNRSGNTASVNAMTAQNTASAFQRLQAAIAEDYKQQKADADANGRQWSMPSSSERFNDQVQAMILSGDPALQERGLALMTPDAMDKPTEFQRNFEYLKQSNPNLSEMDYFKMLHPGPASTRVNVNLPKQEQMVSIDDAQKIVMPDGSNPPVGSTYAWVAAHGGTTVKTKDQADTESSAGTTANASKNLSETSVNLSDKPGRSILNEARTMPGIIGQGINVAANAVGLPQTQTEAQFGVYRQQLASSITKQLSGSAASDQDVARVLAGLPSYSDSPMQRNVKLKAVQQQVSQLVGSAKSRGSNINSAPSSMATQATNQSKPVATKRYNPATGKVEEIR